MTTKNSKWIVTVVTGNGNVEDYTVVALWPEYTTIDTDAWITFNQHDPGGGESGSAPLAALFPALRVLAIVRADDE